MRHIILKIIVCLAASLLFLGPSFAQFTPSPTGVIYKEVKGWTIRQYPFSEGSNSGPSCSAVMFKDRLDGLRIERIGQGYLYGINGLLRGMQGDVFALRLWFDDDLAGELYGDARFTRDAAYPDDDWLSHFHPVNEGPIRDLANKSRVTFSFFMSGNRTGNDQIETAFDLVGSAAALLALDECYETAIGLTATATRANLGCPDDGPRFAGSGVCRGRASNYLNIVDGEAPPLLDGCAWIVNETPMPGGDYLFYLAASCEGIVSRLDFSAGAHFGEFRVARSAQRNGAPGGKIITFGPADADEPYQSIVRYTREAMEDKVAAERCYVQSDPEDAWTADAVWVDVSPEDAVKYFSGGPRWACGPFGYDDEVFSFWRVFDGYAWFFEFGPNPYLDIDPRSLTVVLAEDLAR